MFGPTEFRLSYCLVCRHSARRANAVNFVGMCLCVCVCAYKHVCVVNKHTVDARAQRIHGARDKNR